MTYETSKARSCLWVEWSMSKISLTLHNYKPTELTLLDKLHRQCVYLLELAHFSLSLNANIVLNSQPITKIQVKLYIS